MPLLGSAASLSMGMLLLAIWVSIPSSRLFPFPFCFLHPLSPLLSFLPSLPLVTKASLAHIIQALYWAASLTPFLLRFHCCLAAGYITTHRLHYRKGGIRCPSVLLEIESGVANPSNSWGLPKVILKTHGTTEKTTGTPLSTLSCTVSSCLLAFVLFSTWQNKLQEAAQ